MTSPPCEFCTAPVIKRPSNLVNGVTGRPWKHIFCDDICYAEWRRERHLAVKAQWLKFQREVWGTAPAGRRQPAGMRAFGRTIEIAAMELFTPLGFSEVEDFSGTSNQFFVDFIVTRDDRRGLLDVTAKLKAYFPEKTHLAAALRMPLWILHVSPLNTARHHLQLVPTGNVVSRVPAALIRKWEAESGD